MLDTLICDAIRARKLMMYEYGGLMRIVEPHLYGVNAAGDALLSGWLRPGLSRSDPQGGWRSWRADRIHSAQVLDQQFAGPRPGYNPRDPRMQRVMCALSAATFSAAEPAGEVSAPDDVAPDAIGAAQPPEGVGQ